MKTLKQVLVRCTAILTMYGLSGVYAAERGIDEARLCANRVETDAIRAWYADNPGVVTPEGSRVLELVETKIQSALPSHEAVGTALNREKLATLWESIEKWGANSKTTVVLTVNGYHAYAFPSKVPVSIAQNSEDYFSVAANKGKGARVDFNLDDLSYAFATKLKAANGNYLRTVNFYSTTGDLIIGLYATEPKKPESKKVLNGFNETWKVLDAMQPACQRSS